MSLDGEGNLVANIRVDENNIISRPISEDELAAILAFGEQSTPAEVKEDAEDEATAKTENELEEQPWDDTPRDFRGNPLPMRTNKKGEQVVDETALWNNDPEAWCHYNDADSEQIVRSEEKLEYAEKELAKQADAAFKAMRKATLKGTAQDEMDDLREAYKAQRDRLALIQGILTEYKKPAEEEGNVPGIENGASGEVGSEDEGGGVSGNSQESQGEEKGTTNIEDGETTEGGSNQSETTLLDVVRTIYAKGKEVASKLFGMKYFNVAQTPKFMQELGLRGDKFTIRYGVIARHFGKDSAHTLSQEIWEQLPEALLHPFAITKYYEDEEKRKQKGYRLYTALQLADGSHVVVSAEVKNAGRDIEVNAVNTIFGRNSLSDVHDELIYTSETITPEQSSLLKRNNLAQYPTEQELSTDKDTNSSEETNGSGKESTDSNSEVIADKQADEESGVQSEAPTGQEGQSAEQSERVAEQAETPAAQEEQSAGQAEHPAPLTDAQKQVASELLGVSEAEMEARNKELQEQKRQEPLKARAKEWESRTGVKVNAISSIDEVTNKQARKAIESGETVYGWFEPKTGTVCIYLPHVPNESEIDKTYIHEVVSHKGLRELLGKEGFNSLMDSVWNDMMSDADKASFLASVSHVKGSELDRQRAAADEFVASYAENLDLSKPNSMWDKFVEAVREILAKLGISLKINEKDLSALLQASLARYEQMQAEKRTIAESEEAREDSVLADAQGNPLNADGTLRLEKVNSIDELTDEDFTNPTRSVELPALPGNVDAAIGANGKPVIIKKNIFKKNKRSHSDLSPEQSRNILNSALYNPDLYGQNQKTNRPYNWVVINTLDENGKNRLVLLELNPTKDNIEVVHWHYVGNGGLERIKKQAEREGEHILVLPSSVEEEAGALPGRPSDLSSEDKGSEKSTETSTSASEETFQPTDAQKDVLGRIFGMSPEEVEKEHKARTSGKKEDNVDETLYRKGASSSIEEVNERFNEELSTLNEENADEKVFDLGMPSGILRSAGIADMPMKLYGNKILKKMRKHGFELSELKDLPEAVASPIAVFNNYGTSDNRSILTELKTADGNFLVTLTLGNGIDLDFNIVSSLFGKGDNKIINWFNSGYATYIDKEKALNYLYLSAPIAEAANNSELSTATKIVEDFENPTLPEEDTLYRKRSETAKVIATVNSSQKRVGKAYADALDMEDDILFRMSKNTRATVNSWVGKWGKSSGFDEETIEDTKSELNAQLDAIDDTTTQLAFAKWFCSGRVMLGAEDMAKVEQAVKLARNHKVDPLSFSSPMEIINKWAGQAKGERIDPDTVSTLHKAKELANGIVIYDVDESEESRENMRKIINTHFGKDCSPWCILQGDGNGNLTENSQRYWEYYNAYPKQVVFKNGRLLAFSANSTAQRLFWDRQDEAHEGIPVVGKIQGDKLGRSGTIEYDPTNGETILAVTNLHLGNTNNGEYVEYYNNGNIKSVAHYKDGKLDGESILYNKSGIKTVEHYKGSRRDGELVEYMPDGSVRRIDIYREGHYVGRKATNVPAEDNPVMFRRDFSPEEVNERFNEELQSQIDGTQEKGHVYQLGMPGDILLSCGFPDMPIELSSVRLAEKATQENHIFDISEVKDLVKELNNPWAIFRYGNNAKNVIVGIEHNGKQFLIGIHFNQSYRGMEVSDIRGIFPKDNAEWLNWIVQDKAEYLNKEKIQTLIDKQRINLAEVEYLDLDFVSNVIKNFENPTLSEDDTLFRRYGGRRWYGGNSGYVGYSMSVRADDARDEGRFPKTDFKKEYGLSPRDFDELFNAGVISNEGYNGRPEWHHTSKYGNKTTFYHWDNDDYARIYAENKAEVKGLIGEVAKARKSVVPPPENPYTYSTEQTALKDKRRDIDVSINRAIRELRDRWATEETIEYYRAQGEDVSNMLVLTRAEFMRRVDELELERQRKLDAAVAEASAEDRAIFEENERYDKFESEKEPPYKYERRVDEATKPYLDQLRDFFESRVVEEEDEEDTIFRKESERRSEMNRVNGIIDNVIALVQNTSKSEARAYRQDWLDEHKRDFAEICERSLSGNFDSVTLALIDKYISDATPKNPYGRRISQRVPQAMERGLYEGARANAVDALFTRVSESSIRETGSSVARDGARRAIEEKKKELLRGWAVATGNWHTSISDFTNDSTPIGSGKDSDVYASKDGDSVIKVSKGKDNQRKFRPDIDAVNLFNYAFPNSAYEIVGYGEIAGRFVKFLKQPIVDFAQAAPLTEDERAAYMEGLGFRPINKERTAFSDGTIAVADLQKSNIVKDKAGNVSVIDADVKLHTKDFGGNYTYPDVSEDFPEDDTRFRRRGMTVPVQGEESEAVGARGYTRDGVDWRSSSMYQREVLREAARLIDAPMELVQGSYESPAPGMVDASGRPVVSRWNKGRVEICPTLCRDANDAVCTYLHEVVGHFGLSKVFDRNQSRKLYLGIYKTPPTFH